MDKISAQISIVYVLRDTMLITQQGKTGKPNQKQDFSLLAKIDGMTIVSSEKRFDSWKRSLVSKISRICRITYEY